MKVSINVYDLAMETTRRCNMQCDICLRGDAENGVMPDSVIDAALGAFDSISHITPSGGEPFLVPDTTAKILRDAFEKGVPGFFMTTNGTVSPFSTDGLKIMQEAAKFAPVARNYGESNNEDFLDCAFRVSLDDYHDASPVEYSMWNLLKNVSFSSGADFSILNRGRANEFGIGTSSRDESTIQLECDEYQDELSITAETIYVNVFGECFADVDLSYEQQDNPSELLPGCYLGHISNLRETLFKLALEENPEYADEFELAEAVSA